MNGGDSPSGTVTLPSAYIEESSAPWDVDSDSMRPARANHHEVRPGATYAAEGALVIAAGDGAMAAFESAPRAVQAGLLSRFRVASP